MNCCLQKYTTHQFTYFIYYLFQHNFILIQITNQASHCFDFQSSIFPLLIGLDTLFFLQSILTFIVQTMVSAV